MATKILHAHLKTASLFLDDYSLLKADIEHSTPPLDVTYFVDSIEAYSYVYFTDVNESLSYRRSVGSEKLIPLNEVILDGVLFSGVFKRRVLPCHKGEWLNIDPHDINRKIRSALEAISHALAKAKGVQSEIDDLVVEAEDILEKSEEEQEFLSHLLIKKLRGIAHWLIIYSLDKRYRPPARLADLKKRGLFPSRDDTTYAASEHILPKFKVDERALLVREDAISHFSRLRRGAEYEFANVCDATALAMLHHLNTSIDNERFCLVTRAQSMHRVASELDQEDSALSLKSYLRHPRSLVSLYQLRNSKQREDVLEHLDNFIQVFSRLVETLEAAIHSSEDSTMGSDGSLEKYHESVDERIDECEQALMAGWIASNHLPQAPRLDRLVKLYKSKDRIYDIAWREIRSAFDEYCISSFGLSVKAYTGSEPTRARRFTGMVFDFDNKDAGSEQLLLTDKVFIYGVVVPTSVGFKDPAITNLVENAHVGRDDINRFLANVRVEHSGSFYEQLLFMAFVLGSLDGWELAFVVVDCALHNVDAGVSGSIHHEGYFFRAHARRLAHSLTELSIQKNLVDLEKAAKEYLERYKKTELPARYVNEIASQIASGRLLGGFDIEEGLLRDIAGLRSWDPFVLWEETCKRSDASALDRLVALNGAIYFSVVSGNYGYAQIKLEELRALLSSENMEENQLSANLLHTAMLAQATKEGRLSKSDCARYSKMFSENPDRPFGAMYAEKDMVLEEIGKLIDGLLIKDLGYY